MADGRDWTRVQFEPCLECGLDAAGVPDVELGTEILRSVAAWGRTLASADPHAVRVRPHEDVWSALDYACHVRDLLAVMTERIARMASDDEPELVWWDHEAAVIEHRYHEQVPVLVQEAMSANAREYAATLAALRPDAWERTGTRRTVESFTIRGLSRFVLHEVIHHREDATHSLKGVH